MLALTIFFYNSDAGTRTCADYPGSLYTEDIDVATFTGWGIDCGSRDFCLKIVFLIFFL